VDKELEKKEGAKKNGKNYGRVTVKRKKKQEEREKTIERREDIYLGERMKLGGSLWL